MMGDVGGSSFNNSKPMLGSQNSNLIKIKDSIAEVDENEEEEEE